MSERVSQKDMILLLKTKLKQAEGKLKESEQERKVLLRLLENATLRLSDETIPLKAKPLDNAQGIKFLNIFMRKEHQIRYMLDIFFEQREINDSNVAQCSIIAGTLCEIFNLSIYETEDPYAEQIPRKLERNFPAYPPRPRQQQVRILRGTKSCTWLAVRARRLLSARFAAMRRQEADKDSAYRCASRPRHDQQRPR